MRLDINVKADLEDSGDPTLMELHRLQDADETTERGFWAIEEIIRDYVAAVGREVSAAAERLGHELVHVEVGSPQWLEWRQLSEDEQDRLSEEALSANADIWAEADRDGALTNLGIATIDRARAAAEATGRMTYTVPTNPAYYGQEATEELAARVASRIADALREARPDVDVVVAWDIPPIESFEPSPERHELVAEADEIWERELEAALTDEEKQTR